MLEGLTFAAIIELISGVLKFPNAIYQFVLLLKKTEQEKHDEILKGAAEAADRLAKTGRPTWD